MNKTINVVGVDPGLMGAIAFVGPIICTWDIPTFTIKGKKKSKKRIYDICGIIEILKLKKIDVVFLEKVQTLPRGFTIKSNTGLAHCEGIFEGILTCLNIKYEFVNPRDWQKHFGISSKFGDAKEQSVKAAKQLFPNVILTTPKGRILDGRAEALLIAEYGRLHLEKDGYLPKYSGIRG